MRRRLYIDSTGARAWAEWRLLHYLTLALAVAYTLAALASLASSTGVAQLWNASLLDAVASATTAGFYAKAYARRRVVDGIGYALVASALGAVYALVYILSALASAPIVENGVSNAIEEAARPETALGLVSLVVGYTLFRRATSP